MKKKIQEIVQKRKKKRGLTLIELLAVIVVLAIIALIATPIVMNVIKDSKKGAIERSAERYLDAVETAIATDKLKEGTILDGIYTVNENGNLVLGEKKLTVEVSGDKPEKGSKIAIQNGQVVPTGTKMSMGIYTVTIDDKGSAKAEETKPLCIAIAPSEQLVWDRNVYKMILQVVGIQATKTNPYALGSVYSCDLGDGARTFYVLKEEENTVKLILNENIGENVTWCTSGVNNSCRADGAKAYLTSQTSRWEVLTSVGGIVDLPDAQDIADAMEYKEWNDAITTIIGNEPSGPEWIKTNLYYNNNPSAYWTSTYHTTFSADAWIINCFGKFNKVYTDDKSIGIRPVITISKDNLSL